MKVIVHYMLILLSYCFIKNASELRKRTARICDVYTGKLFGLFYH